jgi:SAM-dependent methyltransferase
VESPWEWFATLGTGSASSLCNICWWQGERFEGINHSESATCPACGSIARDRFLFYCFIACSPQRRYRILETSPRLGEPYRRAMALWFDYTASDFDERAHRSGLHLDLQDLALEDGSLDILLTPHVLEHVPDTTRALKEIRRVLAPGGKMFLQVPVQQGWTAPPEVPELHGDRTPVHWRFGLDLTQRLRDLGFRTRLLCNDGFYDYVKRGAQRWPDPPSAEFDLASILAAVEARDLVPISGEETTRRLSFHPSYMFLTWEAEKPSD